ncbi:MAG: aminotransferase class III-fold pyridoxal phosphate-dependent enzyme [Bacteroidales bacterium]|jgi:glutamate-1-semialdehyde aminotransferase|nr:aminotransferase class III-fold pyridoxal phosphate-dependent enzyme [Bacteroidales bacterium]HOL96879.1 aminotransferase class III-fold pyridoxal phosphate-dependent enzyme [Bacteroidales bacterium]HOM36840.1 aminotransferase class III-fold pyridoxal phosphate-dependent enzyme [Bacteroidales bacterium]HPD24311.1 aminotransferase class III-fold pyridoxal phosphate-dependent enzyme [Bacteroidales bacterium]HRS98436.1 aminotransferase class III-fold pyridoxal phosphate-dependent enzyme [Bacter
MAEKLKLELSEKYYNEALKMIPGAVAGIRRPYNFVPGEYPIFFDNAKGGKVYDVDGNEYLDYLCAYGPIIIGHREEEIDSAVIEQMKNKGFCFSLVQPVQNRLAAKLIELIPSAEMVVFVKTGSDATSTAIRVARGATDRTKVVRCGYHGWHDWCVEVKGGIPQKLYEDVHEVHYNDLDELEDVMKKHGDDMAAIIITPVGHPLAEKVQMPKPGYLEGVRALADKYGTVLIFDEIRSGFRFSLGGAQKVFGVTPDISVFGKAIANGYPISVVVGKEKYMKVLADKVFLSSTFFPNSLEQIAALKTIEILERDKVLDVIAEKGNRFAAKVKEIVKNSGYDAEFSGAPFMPFITFNRDKDQLYKKLRPAFYTELIRRKVFLQPYHHGYIAYRHTDEDLDYTANMIAEAFGELKKYI